MQGFSARGLLRDLLINAGLPLAAYLLLTRFGFSTVAALLVGAAFPAVAAVIGIVRERRAGALSIIALLATVMSAVGALLFTSPLLLLARGSLVTGVIGLAFLISLASRRPLVFHVVASGRDAAGRQRMETLWENEAAFRRLMTRLTLLWAIGLLGEASARLLLLGILPLPVFLPTSEVLWIGFFALMTAWSWRYGNRIRATFPVSPTAT